MKRILIDLQSVETYRFFSRLAAALGALGHAVDFITNTLDVYHRARRDGARVFLTRRRHAQAGMQPLRSLDDVGLLAAGLFTREGVEGLYRPTLGHVAVLQSRHPYDYVFIFSGSLPSHMAIADVAREQGVKTVFFELGNLKGKVFADPEGTNAYSKCYRDPSILDRYAVEDGAYDAWLTAYLKSKTVAHQVPQAGRVRRNRSLRAKLERQAVFAANAVAGVAQCPKLRGINRLQRTLQPAAGISYDPVDLDATGYLFFPMQVLIDAQSLLHCDIGAFDAIAQVYEVARERGLELLVKPHPAESDPTVNRDIVALRDKLGFKLVQDNTYALLKHATEVYTLNSTVGLEAQMLGKPVTFLGRSLFAHFNDNPRYLENYIMHYLIDADFFGQTAVSETAAEQILARADV